MLSSSQELPRGHFQKVWEHGGCTAYLTGKEVSAEGREVVYCDGACKANGHGGSMAGIGVWWGADDPKSVFALLAFRFAHRRGQKHLRTVSGCTDQQSRRPHRAYRRHEWHPLTTAPNCSIAQAIARVLETAPISQNCLVIRTDLEYAIKCLSM